MPDSQFSILFAPEAKTNKIGAGNVATQTWIGRDDNMYYAVTESTSNVAFDAPKELASNFDASSRRAGRSVDKRWPRTPWRSAP